MKKINLIIATTLFSITFSIGAFAQTETKIGALIGYGTEIENIGIGANAEFPIMEKLTISPSFIYYLPKDESGIKINWFEVNANANYYFLDEENIDVYGIAGLNYSSIKVKYENSFGLGGDFSSSDGRIGLNLGAGANFNIGSSITPFAELKYVIIDGGQLVVAAGVKFNL
ncbi:outer membrane protein [Winogradskyella thalassocola]|uniref:Outer membrane protein beta-barrel domain-containing protein n=1 Tax=Winogradskyella thalassocola TaxID=262004 RepID=A0A1G8HPD3_9FLAO|nr:outer membrane beta-barrel protein [Winogradskyella thalassocola]SDI08527.1 Outer membrane protein beta-barrel domain-containing protein [Winogradskyella thalassocola]